MGYVKWKWHLVYLLKRNLILVVYKTHNEKMNEFINRYKHLSNGEINYNNNDSLARGDAFWIRNDLMNIVLMTYGEIKIIERKNSRKNGDWKYTSSK